VTEEADYDEQVEITKEMASSVPRSIRGIVRQAANDYRLVAATKYGATPMIVLLVITFLDGVDQSILGVAAPEIRRDFNVTLTQIAVIGQLFTLPAIMATPLIGYLNDRMRRTRLMGITTAVSGTLSILSALPRTYIPFAALRTTDKISESLVSMPNQTLFYDYYPVEARAKVVALRQLFTALAGFAVGPFVALMITIHGWRATYVAVSIPLGFSGLLAVFFLKEPVRGYWERVRAGVDEESANSPQVPMRFAEAFRTLLAVKTLRRTLVLLPVLGLASGGFSTLFNFYLKEQFHLSPFQRSIIGLPSGVLGLAFIVAGGSVADGLIKRNPRRVMVLQGSLGLATTACHLFIVAVPSLPILIVSGMIISLIGYLITPATATVTSLIVPARLRGQGASLVVLMALPLIILAPIPAYIADHYSLRIGLLFFGPISIVGSLLSISASRFINADMRAAIASANATNEYNRAKKEGTIKLLLLRDVDVAYDGVQVVFNVDLTIDQGETIALLGTNGAGKSTILRAVSGIQEADNGAIFFDGVDITHKPPYEIARLGIVHMPGGKCVFPGLTVRENLEMAQLELDDADDRTARLDHVFGLFPRLRERLEQTAGSLSGGEQQMVGLAQAFLWRPRLLMIDELSLGLSPAVVGELLESLREIQALGTTIILVEQSVNVALTVAERAIFLEKGQIRFDGRTADLLARPDIMRAVYLKGAGAFSDRRRPIATAGASAEQSRVVLECEGVTVSYGGVKALQNVSFTLHEGETLGLIGPNGSGKTTLFDVISGFLPPDAGVVRYDARDINRLRPTQRAELGLVRRFQDAKLFSSLTVFEALCVSLDKQLEVRSAMVTALQLPSVRRSEQRIKTLADRAIDLLELGAYRDKFVAELSTGLRRIVDLGCAMAAGPRVLLLDEPSSGIAQAEAESLGPLLRRIKHETGCSLLIIEHDMPLIRSVSDELMALVLGQVVVRGPADEVLEHPVVVDAYLGTSEEALNRSGLMPR